MVEFTLTSGGKLLLTVAAFLQCAFRIESDGVTIYSNGDIFLTVSTEDEIKRVFNQIALSMHPQQANAIGMR